MTEQKILRLILGDQLNSSHQWFERPRPHIAYTIMEVRQETDYAVHHIQKVAGFFAAMRHFAHELVKKGHQVFYFRLDDPENTQSIEENLQHLIQEKGFSLFEYQLPDEYRMDQLLKQAASRLPVPVNVVESEHFLTDRKAVGRFFMGKKRFLMESFYRYMRKKYNILMENGRPVGDKWNYDASNRRRYDGAVTIPAPMAFDTDVSNIVGMISTSGVKTIGAIDPKHLIWPVTRKQALVQMDDFMRERLPYFGVYQDAMSARSWSMFHSRLSFALNTKMLHPMEVIDTAIRQSHAPGSKIAIEPLEGFIRQILGWREFVRGIYWDQMPGYETLNYFGHSNPLPDFYWTGDTRMNCMAAAIRQSLDYAYAHHIQRLMLTGNFALLAGVHPDAVDAWYLGIYMDAVQWVEIVNTRGMSQFADGGIVATKPYIASANYIRKMGDYCEDCFYDADKSAGERACPFNSMYWDFLNRHRQKLSKNPRMGIMYGALDRMDENKKADLFHQAAKYKVAIHQL
jgi:deoxyribodipyrimidine photolyase-related protein